MAAKGTGDDLTAGQTNHEQDGFELVADPHNDGSFGSGFILRVVQSNGLFSTSIDGLQAQVSDGRGTWLLSDGADMRWVSQQLGHATTAQTADVYGHVQPERHESATA